jgi:hypothetical protein
MLLHLIWQRVLLVTAAIVVMGYFVGASCVEALKLSHK